MKTTPLQTRREFCVRTCQTASWVAFSGALAAVLEGCSSSDNPTGVEGAELARIQASVVNQTITLTIDASSPLAAVGSAALVQYSGGAMLVAHTAQDAFTALTAICTHQGCTISNYGNATYTCPCHGSQFGSDGRVVRGPASSPLRSYQTQFANNQLVIRL